MIPEVDKEKILDAIMEFDKNYREKPGCGHDQWCWKLRIHSQRHRCGTNVKHGYRPIPYQNLGQERWRHCCL